MRYEIRTPLEWDELRALRRPGLRIVRAILSVTPHRSAEVPGSDEELREDLARELGRDAVPASAVVIVSDDLDRPRRERDDHYLSELVIELPDGADRPRNASRRIA